MKHFYFNCLLFAMSLFGTMQLQAQCAIEQTVIDAGLVPSTLELGMSFVPTEDAAIESISYHTYNGAAPGTDTMTLHLGDSGENALGSVTYAVPASGYNTATFDSPIAVTSGQIYTFMVLSTEERGIYGALNDLYPEGEFLRNLAGTFSVATNPDFDMRFEVKYVNNVPPVFTEIITSEITVQLDGTGSATVMPSDFDITAVDDCGDVITYTMSQTTFDCNDIGSNTIEFTATDEDGNAASTDVVINIGSATPNVSLTSGNVILTDLNALDDEIVLRVEGANYRFHNASATLVADTGITQDCGDVLIPISAVTGFIQIDGEEGNDLLTVDYSGGVFTSEIFFNGGTELATPGDMLSLVNASVASVDHTFINSNDGAIAVSGNAGLTYTGLEPIIDNLDAANRSFLFTGGAEAIVLSDDTTTNNNTSFIDSSLGESVTFVNPSNSLTVDAGTGDDTINVEGLDAQFNAALILEGGSETDQINFQTNTTQLNNGALSGIAETIFVSADVTTTGDISLTADKNLQINSTRTLLTTDGDITLTGGNAPSMGDDFIGVRVNGGIVRTTGVGNISITGTGAYNSSSFRHGVEIRNAGIVETTGLGTITLTGTGADGDRANSGLFIFESNARIASNGGGITINGTAGDGTGISNIGVVVSTDGIIRDLNGGDININGTGAGAANQNYGVQLRNGGLVSSSSGAVTLIGQGSLAGGSASRGIEVINGAMVTTQEGQISILGTAGGTGSGVSNQGVYINNTAIVNASGTGAVLISGTANNGGNDCTGFILNNSTITTNGGGITINGFGGNGTGNNSRGVVINGTGGLRDTNSGVISITGTGGEAVASGHGVQISGTDAYVETINGTINVSGTAGDGTGNSNQGIYIFQSRIEDLGTGSIMMNGIGGNAAAFNRGVEIINAASVRSNGGNITLEGTGGDGSGNFNVGMSIRNNNPTVSTTGAGTIIIQGTSGATGNANFGNELTGGAVITTENGNITLTGVAANTSGGGQDGLRLEGNFISNTGNIIVNGTSGTSGAWAIAFRSNTNLIQTGGDVTFNANNSERIVTTAGVPANNLVDANTIIINGILRPGDNNRAQFPVAGAFTMSADDELVFDIAGFADAGSDYDQIQVSGAVILNDATLSLNNSTGSAEDACDTIVLISNDGADGVVGTFIGIAEGGSISSGGITGKISYTGGDGNDVVLILDDTEPVASCQDITIQLDNFGNASIVATDIDNGSSDNCGIASLMIDQTDFTCADVGANTVTLTVMDTNGNTATCTATVTVEDSVAPEALCQDITVQLDAAGMATVLAASLDGGSSDNCTNVILGVPGRSGTVSATANERTDFTISAPAGQVFTGIEFASYGTPTGTAGDFMIDPSCHASNSVDIMEERLLGQNSVTFRVTNSGFGDPCSGTTKRLYVTASYGIANSIDFDCWQVGPNTVPLFVTDDSGNISYCNAIVTVEDPIAPDAVCQDIIVPLDATGNVSITAEDIDGGSSDACGIASLSVDQTNFTCSDVGDNVVTLSVTDVNGNVSTCMATVTVQDTLAPNAVCQDVTIQLDASGTASIVASDVDGGSNDNCGIASLMIDQTDFTCADVGANTVTLTVTDVNGNTSSCAATVIVEDNIAPAISCPSDVLAETDPGQCSAVVFFPNAIAIDNCEIASVTQTEGPASGSAFPVGETLIEFTAEDVNGNTTVCTFTITVTDNEAPLAVCENITVQLDATGNASITAVDVDGGSSDNCGIASTMIDITDFTCADVGTNAVTLTVTDINGNISTCVATVTIEDTVAPIAVCQDITVELDATGTVTIDATQLDGGSSDACGIASLSVDNDTFDCSNVGANSVTLTVTDVNGNVSTCTATVTVEDNTTPELVCMDITVSLDENGVATITANDVIDSATDACGIDTSAVDITEFGCADIGNPVTVNVFTIDVNGNATSCTATVTVIDELAPEIICPDDQLVSIPVGSQYEVPDYVIEGLVTAADNCTDPVAIFTQDPAAGTLLDIGTYTVTVTAEDDYGNIATCDFELTVDEELGSSNTTLNINSIVMYPNPAQATVYLSNSKKIDLEKAEVYDVRGRLVAAYSLRNMNGEMALDISNLASATYTVVIYAPNQRISKQLIKE